MPFLCAKYLEHCFYESGLKDDNLHILIKTAEGLKGIISRTRQSNFSSSKGIGASS
ncbi:hypothetical protein OROMI_027898 [Orobanche minor]